MSFLWDSYAVIELISGNPDYAKYSEEKVRVTIFNLVEIYWFAVHEYDTKDALEIYETYRKAVVEPDDETLRNAVEFRKEQKKEGLSYADCIGYIYAKRNGLKFITGDMQFEKMQNVEYVK